jgi:hypothetical protein
LEYYYQDEEEQQIPIPTQLANLQLTDLNPTWRNLGSWRILSLLKDWKQLAMHRQKTWINKTFQPSFPSKIST